ncbi:hypothetical protein AB4Z48_12125 [Cupriavidus sp. 2TAF22]|uniref:hypothetical protein n=1 Tax=unclassified Cupriavidus TaxID=2640874 RepID=UPI003F8F1CE4
MDNALEIPRLSSRFVSETCQPDATPAPTDLTFLQPIWISLSLWKMLSGVFVMMTRVPPNPALRKPDRVCAKH